MRKLITSIACLILLGGLVFAQIAAGFKYQAVVRDASGNVLANKNVSIKLSVLKGDDNGPVEFSELHYCVTNEFGLINIQVGEGIAVTGFFGDVHWGDEKHYMKVEMDPEGGNNFTVIGVSELMAVPYAMHAETVTNADDADADPTNEIQDLKLVGNSIRITGNPNPTSIDLTPFIGSDDQQISYDNVTHQLVIEDGNTVNLSDLKDDDDADPTNEIQNIYRYGNNLTLSRGGGTVSLEDSDSDTTNELQTISQVGNVVTLSKGGGTINVSDGDDNASNEIQNLSFNNNYLFITDNPNATIIDLNPFMDNTDDQQLSFDPNTGKLALESGGLVDLSSLKDDADADPSNEIQTVSQNGTDVTLSQGGGTFSVADNDNDATNELQTLSQNGSVVTLSNGGGSITISDDDSSPTNELQDLALIGDTLIITNNINATPIDLSYLIDDDGNPMNEIQNLYLQGDSLIITDNPFANIIDLSPYKDNTDEQDLTLSGNTLSLTGDATPVDLTPYLDNTDEQDLTLTGNTLSLTGDATPVDLSPYLDNTDEQVISISNDTISLTNGGFVKLPVDQVDDADADATNELQNISQSGNTVTLSNGGGSIDLSAYLDNTDAQTLSISNDTISLTNGGYIKLPVDQVDDADADATNELQTISQSGNTVTLSNGGGSVDLTSYMDNTDQQTISLSNDSLSIQNGNSVDLSPYLDSKWQESGSDIYVENKKVGIGTNSPSYPFEVNISGTGSSVQDQAVADNGNSFGSCSAIAQSFQAGQSGNLASIKLKLFSATPYQIQVEIVDGNDPNGATVLATETLSMPTTVQWYDVTFSSPPAITAGNDYTIRVNYNFPGTNCYTIYYNDGNPYANGNMFVYDNMMGNWSTWNSEDLPFETYIATTTSSVVAVSSSGLVYANGTEGVGKVLTSDASGNATWQDLPADVDTDDQILSLSGNTLSIADGNSVDLSSYLDNTDAQSLSLSGDTLSISGGNSVIMSSSSLDNQTLSISNDSLFISNGNKVSLTHYLQDLTHQDLPATKQVTIKISNGANTTISVFDGDSSTTNELQTISQVLTKGNDAGGTSIANVGQIQSTVVTGTAPFTVASTTKVANLNADLMDGLNSTDFVQAANNLSDIGNVATARINLGLGTTDTPTFSGVTLTGDAEVGSSDAFYFGDKTTDGSWRIVRSGNDINFERRESGSWVLKAQMNP